MKRRCELLTITSPKNMTPAVLEVSDHISLKDTTPDLPYGEPSGMPCHGQDDLGISEGDNVMNGFEKLETYSNKQSALSSPRSVTGRETQIS